MMSNYIKFPQPWQLKLTKDEEQLFGNLTPDFASGGFKSEFQVKVVFSLEDFFTIDELITKLEEAKDKGATELMTVDADEPTLMCTGSVPLTDDERVVYDSLMVKMRAFRKEQMEMNIISAEEHVAKLKADLDNYVW